MKFVATVVLYNPENDLIDNIKSYSEAVEKVYVIDNSEHPDAMLVASLQDIPKLEYLPLGENKGIACALNLALREAKKDRADYLLTMDQDTAFRENDAKKMIDFIIANTDDAVAIYAANTADYDGYKDSENVTLMLTSGNVIKCDVIDKIGGFDESLFIDWVDQDICYRLINIGYRLCRLNRMRIYHRLGKTEVIDIFGYKMKYVTHSPIRYYYMTRNKFYVLRKNGASLLQMIRFFFGTLIMGIQVVLLENNKRKKVKSMAVGIYDFFRGRMGKYRRI